MLALVPVAYGGQGVLAKVGVDAGNGNCPEGARDGIDGAARLAGMLGQQEVTVTVEARDSHGNVIRFETEPDAAPAPANRDASACTA